MKSRKSLALAIAAMIVSLNINGPATATAPTPEQLAVIETYVQSGDFAALAALLAAFPELMDASTTFGMELSSFFDAYSAAGTFAFSQSTLSAMQNALSSVPTTVAQRGSVPQTASSLY